MAENDRDLVDEIIRIEWHMFDRVQNEGGRASCQDNPERFYAMRSGQLRAFDRATCESYLADLHAAEADGRNPVAEKYAYMGGHAYMGDAAELPRKQDLIAAICEPLADENTRLQQRYPWLFRSMRPVSESREGTVSIGDYLQGELLTYSASTLEQLKAYTDSLAERGSGLAERIMMETVASLGYTSLDDAEAAAKRQLQDIAWMF